MRIPHSPDVQGLDTSMPTPTSAGPSYQSQGAEPGTRTTSGAYELQGSSQYQNRNALSVPAEVDSTQRHDMAQTTLVPSGTNAPLSTLFRELNANSETSALERTLVTDDELRALSQEQEMLRTEKDRLQRLQEIEARELEIRRRIEARQRALSGN
jgi:hypothetical protein